MFLKLLFIMMTVICSSYKFIRINDDNMVHTLNGHCEEYENCLIYQIHDLDTYESYNFNNYIYEKVYNLNNLGHNCENSPNILNDLENINITCNDLQFLS